MKAARRFLRDCAGLLLALALAQACGFDASLRAYLSTRFWLPFARQVSDFEKGNVRRVTLAFAGMNLSEDDAPLAKLRTAYHLISQPITEPFDFSAVRQAVAAARADPSLSNRDREEVDLIDAKIDMRAHMPGETELLLTSKTKLEQFLKTAQTGEFLSEARGWLAHIYVALGDQASAGKIYLDELSRDGSNLSRETILNSLSQTYRSGGGSELIEHLDEYFDTAEHAAFAVQLATNPGTGYDSRPTGDQPHSDSTAQVYGRIQNLLERHKDLLQSETGINALGLLSMRTALRAGDPSGAIKIAGMIPADADIRSEPDFEWMLGSAYFLSHNFAAAEKPLLSLFQSPRSSSQQKAAAAYGLCGVYRKTNNVVEEIYFAIELRGGGLDFGALSVAWYGITWDLPLLLDAEAPLPALEGFLAKYPGRDAQLVKYALAVRLARLDRYDEAARIYQSIDEPIRAERMRRLAALYRETNRTDLPDEQLQSAKYAFAEFVADHQEGIYFNDTLWAGYQRYVLSAERQDGFTGAERREQIALERKLQDDQEERWRAYLILRGIVQDSGKTELGMKAARLAINCVRKINSRFGRRNELLKADIELSRWLRE